VGGAALPVTVQDSVTGMAGTRRGGASGVRTDDRSEDVVERLGRTGVGADRVAEFEGCVSHRQRSLGYADNSGSMRRPAVVYSTGPLLAGQAVQQEFGELGVGLGVAEAGGRGDLSLLDSDHH
jgi:hypothetical protein